jgi:hypothetical protein
MKLNVGNPVEGEDFFDREQEQQRAWRKLESSHLLMLAPRRIGKTSLILRLCDTAHAHGFQAVQCSFARCGDEQECVSLLFRTLAEQQARWERLVEPLKTVLGKLKGVKIGGVGIEWQSGKPADWREVGDALGKVLDEGDTPWLICVDEVPVFVINLITQGEDGKRRARAFLNWFRDLRQRHYKQVKWLLAGSIGLDTIAARLGWGDAINDLEPFPLAAFDEAAALAFLARLAASYRLPLEEPACKAIVKRVGWPVPYYLQVMFSQLRDDWADNSVKPDEAAVERAFERLLDPTYRVHFDYWRQRLDEELGQPEASHAILLLDHACQDANGLSRDGFEQALSTRIQDPDERHRILRYLLDVLGGDGYLVERDGRHAFRMEWLRVYWQRRLR